MGKGIAEVMSSLDISSLLVKPRERLHRFVSNGISTSHYHLTDASFRNTWKETGESR